MSRIDLAQFEECLPEESIKQFYIHVRREDIIEILRLAKIGQIHETAKKEGGEQ